MAMDARKRFMMSSLTIPPTRIWPRRLARPPCRSLYRPEASHAKNKFGTGKQMGNAARNLPRRPVVNLLEAGGLETCRDGLTHSAYWRCSMELHRRGGS